MPYNSTNSQANSLINQSNAYLQNKDYQRAFETAEKANQISPNNSNIILCMAAILIKQEKYKKALVYLEQLDRREANNSVKDYLLGRVYYETAKVKREIIKASEYLNKATDFFIDKNEDSDCLYFAGTVNSILARMDIQKNPEAGLQRYNAAIGLLQIALSINKFEESHHAIISHLYRAEGFYYQEKYEQSIKSLFYARKMLNGELCPNLEIEWKRLSELLEKVGYGDKIAKMKQYKELQQEKAKLQREYDLAVQKKNQFLQEQRQIQFEVGKIQKTIAKNNTDIREMTKQNKRNLDEFGQGLYEVLDGNHKKITQVQVSNNPSSLYHLPLRQPAQQAVSTRKESHSKNECSMM